jgi:hypothetical protein
MKCPHVKPSFFFLLSYSGLLSSALQQVVEETEEGLATIDQTDIRGLVTAGQ